MASNGDIYTVTSENKNYIWNGTGWVEYSANIDLEPIEKELITTKMTEVAEELTIFDVAAVNGKLAIKSGKSLQYEVASPNNMVGIRNVGENGIVNLKLENKNKFDLQKWFKKANRNLCTATLLENGVKLDFTAGDDAFVGIVTTNKGDILSEGYREQLIEIKAQKEYTLRLSSAPSCFLGFYDENYVSLGYSKIPTNFEKTIYTFTTHSQAKYMTIRLGIRDATYSTYNITNIQLEEGNVATEFIEHQEQTISIPLEEVLHKDGYLTGEGIHQKRKNLILNGTEDWKTSIVNDSVNRFSVNVLDINNSLDNLNNILVLSNYFIGISHNDRNNIDNSIFSFCDGASSTLCINTSLCSTVEEWKLYLSEQYANGTPVIVEYELKEQIIIPYTEEQEEAYYKLQNLLMYEGYTNITCMDEIKPDIQLTYYYNNNLNKTYAKRLDSIEERLRLLEK